MKHLYAGGPLDGQHASAIDEGEIAEYRLAAISADGATLGWAHADLNDAEASKALSALAPGGWSAPPKLTLDVRETPKQSWTLSFDPSRTLTLKPNMGPQVAWLSSAATARTLLGATSASDAAARLVEQLGGQASYELSEQGRALIRDQLARDATFVAWWKRLRG